MTIEARRIHRRLSALAVRAALVGGIGLAGAAGATSHVALPHVHGLAYDASGTKLYAAVHDGLAVYSEGRWSLGPGPRHDYMGFAGTRKFFFTSGHPAPGTRLVNPLGLMQSTDGGETWVRRGLEGESDFHLLAAGFETDAIYVHNPAPNSRMKEAGIHHTLNQGLSWRRAAAAGLEGKLHALAAHPTDAGTVAASTDAGLYLSRDHGARFEPVASGAQALGLRFDVDGKHLWFGSFGGAATLQRISLDGARREDAALPQLGRDAVAHIAQNPARPDEIAIATFERRVFVSRDRGKTWKEIAAGGRPK